MASSAGDARENGAGCVPAFALPWAHPYRSLTTRCFEGEGLTHLIQKIGREIELGKKSTEIPEKIWIKQQLSVGVNEVTRALERMPKIAKNTGENLVSHDGLRKPSVRLQAVILAVDCNPKLLIKHIPCLASSRGVPLIFIRDNRAGSLRLGELANLKTAMAIGIKCRGSRINAVISEILQDDI